MRFNTTIDQTTPSANPATFQQLSSDLNKMQEDFVEQKKMLCNKFKGSFETLVKQFFECVPEIKAIAWTQYTPYFNDGDTCTFNVNSIYFLTFIPEDNEGYYEEEDDGKVIESYMLESSNYKKEVAILSPEKQKMCLALNNIIETNEEFLLDMFGDHKKILITKERGIEDEEYDHD